MVDSQGTLRIFVNGRQVAKGPNIQTQAVFLRHVDGDMLVLGSRFFEHKKGGKKMSQKNRQKA